MPKYQAVIMAKAEETWAKESQRFRQELVDNGLAPASLALQDETNMDKSLRDMIESVAEEALNRELGNLQRQQIELTRSTPAENPEGGPTIAVVLTTLALPTLATIASEAVAAGLNAGRDRVLKAVDEDPEIEGTLVATRNEVLDKNTCEECERLDGYEATYGTDDFYKNSPPNFCEGRGRCRGFWDIEPAKQDPQFDYGKSLSKDDLENSLANTVSKPDINKSLIPPTNEGDNSYVDITPTERVNLKQLVQELASESRKSPLELILDRYLDE